MVYRRADSLAISAAPQATAGGFMAKVLLVGYIPELLQEPERLLRSAGHEVIMALSFDAAATAIQEGAVQESSIDVAVFGFSIPEAERNQLAADLMQACPAAKIIMVYFASVNNTELADALMPTTASAEEILRAVTHMLAKGRDRAG
jgi:methylmalonyl-CoA mutase cobalamin-binding subunit